MGRSEIHGLSHDPGGGGGGLPWRPLGVPGGRARGNAARGGLGGSLLNLETVSVPVRFPNQDKRDFRIEQH